MIGSLAAGRAPDASISPEPHVYSMEATRSRRYDVHWVSSIRDEVSRRALMQFHGRRALVVCTPTLGRLYVSSVERLLSSCGISCDTVVVPGSELSKNWSTVDRLCTAAYKRGLGRGDVFVSLGGGACSDVVSVAAALFRRGVGVIRIPTTLIAQVDAAIGVKGAINYRRKKNALGVYLAPDLVLIDTEFLSTLDASGIRNGLAEILKIGIVRDSGLFRMVVDEADHLIASRFQGPSPRPGEVVRLAGLAMLEELASNLYEDRTFRRLVDFGHTISPALEAASGFRLTHGEAVAVDTALSTAIGAELGFVTPEDRDSIVDALTSCGLPIYSTHLTAALFQEALQEARRHRGGSINLVVPTRVGAAEFLADGTQLNEYLFRSVVSILKQRIVA